MTDLTTVFLFTEKAEPIFGDLQIRLLFPLPILILIFLFGVLPSRKPKSGIHLFEILFLVGWAGLWYATHIFSYFFESEKYSRLKNTYNTQQYRVVAGAVHILRTQPASGHAPGDLVRINDTELEVDYYSITFGYSTSIAHGGVLKEGQDVLVYYTDSATWVPVDRTILRIDMKKR